MTAPLRRFITQQVVVGALINAVLNALFGWLAIRDGASWPLWGVPSVAADVVAMAFGIAFGTGLLLTPQLRKQLAAGKLVAPVLPASWVSAFARWPRSGFQRGVNLGVLSVLAFGAPTIALLVVVDVANMDRMQLAQLKGLFGFVVGGVLTPPFALAVVADAQGAAGTAQPPMAEAS